MGGGGQKVWIDVGDELFRFMLARICKCETVVLGKLSESFLEVDLGNGILNVEV